MVLNNIGGLASIRSPPWQFKRAKVPSLSAIYHIVLNRFRFVLQFYGTWYWLTLGKALGTNSRYIRWYTCIQLPAVVAYDFIFVYYVNYTLLSPPLPPPFLNGFKHLSIVVLKESGGVAPIQSAHVATLLDTYLVDWNIVNIEIRGNTYRGNSVFLYSDKRKINNIHSTIIIKSHDKNTKV